MAGLLDNGYWAPYATNIGMGLLQAGQAAPFLANRYAPLAQSFQNANSDVMRERMFDLQAPLLQNEAERSKMETGMMRQKMGLLQQIYPMVMPGMNGGQGGPLPPPAGAPSSSVPNVPPEAATTPEFYPQMPQAPGGAPSAAASSPGPMASPGILGAPQTPGVLPGGSAFSRITGRSPGDYYKQGLLFSMVGLPGGEEMMKEAMQYDPGLIGETEGAKATAAVGPHLQEKGFAPGPDGTQHFVPGGIADPAYIRQEKSAEAGGTLPFDMAKLGYAIGPGGRFAPIAGGPADPATLKAAKGAEAIGAAQGELVPGIGPDGRPTMVPKSSLLGGGGPSPMAPGSGPNPAFRADYTPAEKKLGELDATALDKYRTEATQTQNIEIGSKQLLDAMSQFKTGSGAPALAAMTNAAKYIGFKLPPNLDPTNAQVFNKVATNMVYAAVKAMGNRPLVAEIEGLSKAFPNLTLTPEANAEILATVLADSRWKSQRFDAANQYFHQNGSLGTFDTEFNRANPMMDTYSAVHSAFERAGVPLPYSSTGENGNIAVPASGGSAPQPAKNDAIDQSMITPENIAHTAKLRDMSEDQVKAELRARGYQVP